jgi:hypothetical protein
MANQTVKLQFDGEMHDCLVTTADSGEIVCYRKDRQFVKFPAGSNLPEEVKKHNKANSDKPVTAEVVEARQAALDEWFED